MPSLTLAFPLLLSVFLYSTYQLIDYMPHLFIPFAVCRLQWTVNSMRAGSLIYCVSPASRIVVYIARPRWTYVEYMNEWTGYSAISWAQPTGFTRSHLSFTICYFLTWNPYSRHYGLLLLWPFFPNPCAFGCTVPFPWKPFCIPLTFPYSLWLG